MANGRRSCRSIRICVAAALAASILGLPAEASNFGSFGTPGAGGTNNGVWLTPDSGWLVGRRALTAPYSTGVAEAVGEEYGPTDLNVGVFSPSTCDIYDVCVYDHDYGDNGLNGWNACAGAVIGNHPTQKCVQAWVRINLFFSPPPKRIACHELGHSVGLRHTDEQASCVKRTIEGGNSETLSAHDKAHINDNY